MKCKFYRGVFYVLASSVILIPISGCDSKKISASSDSSILDNSVINQDADVSFDEDKKINDVTTTSEATINMTTSSTTSDVTKDDDNLINSDVTTTDTGFGNVTTSQFVDDVSLVQLTKNDNEVLAYFKDFGNSIKENINSSDLLDKGKAYFICCVDFLFYDGTVRGITFNELTDSAKKMLLSEISQIDALICTKFPNYKESISDKSGAAYNKAGELIKAGSKNLNDFSKEKLGDDNYNKMIEIKDLFVEQTIDDFVYFKDVVGDGLEIGKSKIKEWYEGLR